MHVYCMSNFRTKDNIKKHLDKKWVILSKTYRPALFSGNISPQTPHVNNLVKGLASDSPPLMAPYYKSLID